MDEELEREINRYNFVVEDAKRYFGEWDSCDPVVWAILRVVQAQNDLAHAMDQVAAYGVNGRVVEEAIAERSKAIAALQEAWRERHIERRRTVQRITSLLLRQTRSDAHLETLGGLLQQIMNREAARALRRALKPPSNEEMAAAP